MCVKCAVNEAANAGDWDQVVKIGQAEKKAAKAAEKEAAPADESEDESDDEGRHSSKVSSSS